MIEEIANGEQDPFSTHSVQIGARAPCLQKKIDERLATSFHYLPSHTRQIKSCQYYEGCWDSGSGAGHAAFL